MAQALRGQGYRAYALLGGLEGWLEAGYPIEPKPAERGRTVAEVCPDCGQPLAGHASRAKGPAGDSTST